MPYTDKAMKSQRQKERRLKSRSEAPVILEDYKHHPILYALTDPIKRDRLEKICKALDRRNLQSRLYYGCGDYSISFDIIEDLLEATR